MERGRTLKPNLLVGAAAALISVWIVAQRYVGDYAAISGPWLSSLVLIGAVAVALAVALRALRSKRLPWTETLLSTSILVLTDVVWRVGTSHDDKLAYKAVWAWIGMATPFILVATWAVAATLALGLVKRST